MPALEKIENVRHQNCRHYDAQTKRHPKISEGDEALDTCLEGNVPLELVTAVDDLRSDCLPVVGGHYVGEGQLLVPDTKKKIYCDEDTRQASDCRCILGTHNSDDPWCARILQA